VFARRDRFGPFAFHFDLESAGEAAVAVEETVDRGGHSAVRT
jgi:hypothetical protein